MQLTKPQQSLFWRSLAASCAAQGIISSYDREAYRKQVLREECKAESMKGINRTSDFDACLKRFAIDAGNYDIAYHYDTGKERRLAHLVEACAAQVMALHGSNQDNAMHYIIGILTQARFSGTWDGSTWWLDLTGDHLLKVFQMLDTHRRRLLRKAGWKGSMLFDPAATYNLDQNGITIISQAPQFSTLRVRVA